MNNLKKFETEAEYQAWKDGDDYVFPNICKVGEEVVYNNYPEPFWIEALEDISVNYYYSGDKKYFDGYWSCDKIKWTKFSESDVIVRKGEKIYLHSNRSQSALYVSGKYNVGGSILSLVYNLEYLSKNTHSVDFFKNLLVNAKNVVNAKDLVLADVLPEHRSSGNGPYAYLFQNCSLLESAPKLPNIVNETYHCFKGMFFGCTNLTTAPTIKKINSYAGGCCNSMFDICPNLAFIKLMDTNAFNGASTPQFQNWVSGVSPTGTFIANAKRTDFTRGVHGIPVGWDLYLYDEDNDRYVVKFKVNNIPYEFYTDKPRSVQWDEFCRSEHNTNGFTYPIGASRGPVKSGSDFILLGGNNVMEDDKIVLNASYTIGQPTATTEEE
jgi:hypothetical protein